MNNLIDIRPQFTLDLTELPVAYEDLPVDMRPALVYIASLSRGSHRTMIAALNEAARIIARDDDINLVQIRWHMLRYQHVQALRAWLLSNNYKPSTANKILSAVRGALLQAKKLKLMSVEDYDDAVSVKSIQGSTVAEPTGREVTVGQFGSLLDKCAEDPTPAGPRDASILGLGMMAGLRRAEIASLQLADYDREQQRLTIIGKGNKTRIIPINQGLADALDDWLTARGDEPGPLFRPVHRSGKIQPGGITAAAIRAMMLKRGEQAKIPNFSPHDLRRTFAGNLLDVGADIVTVQNLMGHSSPTTTARYDRRGERVRRDAIDRLHMPWRKR